MAWVRVINPEEATGELRGVYEDVGRRRGTIANVYRAGSLNAEALRAHLDLYMALLYRKGGLTRAQRETIGVLVSSLNSCDYCVTHHSEALSRYEHSRSVEEISKGNLRAFPEGSKERAMLEYCVKLTERPATMGKEDVDDLRDVGFDDPEIVDINLIASYFNFVNRVVSGLGVELEQPEERTYKY